MDLADMAASVVKAMLASSGVGGDGRAGMTDAGGQRTEKLGYLGLGLMGLPMTRRLLRRH
jgi:hypothetical protein